MADATTLVKYLAAHSPYSRRKVTDLIKEGKVMVNSAVVTEPWYAVKPSDDIRIDGKKVVESRKVYFLLNKPAGYITTMEDEMGREHVAHLMKGATKERIYPIGRLDQETTGLLLFTNDGELAQRLSHPRFSIQKEYMVTLDKPVNPEHLHQMFKGVFLRDGKARVDRAVLVPGKRKYVAILELHSGKKHIVRRLFEHFGYEVRHLDRISYAGLSKKGLSVGKWRALTQDEVASLQAMAQNVASRKTKKTNVKAKRPFFSDKKRRPSGPSFGAGLDQKSRFKPKDRPDIRKKKESIIGTEEWFSQDDDRPVQRRAHKKENFDIESWFSEGEVERPADVKTRTRKKSTAVSTKPAFKRSKPRRSSTTKTRKSGGAGKPTGRHSGIKKRNK